MKGVIPAAGSGTRLWPITKVVNKTLLHVYDRPVIYYVIDNLIKSGICEVMVIVPSAHFNQFTEILKDGKEFGLRNLELKTCDHTLGMPYSIRQAKEWGGREPIMVIPGDNIFLQSFTPEISKFQTGALAFLRKVKDPSRFGVPVYRKNRVVNFIEKPQKPKTSYAVVAPYIFDFEVYNYIDSLKPSQRGELEIVDLLRIYLGKSKLKLQKKRGYWKDIGTPDSFVDAGVYLRNWVKRYGTAQ